MKKPIWYVVLFVATVVIGSVSYLYWAFSTFAPREIKKRTGAQEVHVVEQSHTDNSWYARAEFDQQTGNQLLARYDWKRGFERNSRLQVVSFLAVSKTAQLASTGSRSTLMIVNIIPTITPYTS